MSVGRNPSIKTGVQSDVLSGLRALHIPDAPPEILDLCLEEAQVVSLNLLTIWRPVGPGVFH